MQTLLGDNAEDSNMLSHQVSTVLHLPKLLYLIFRPAGGSQLCRLKPLHTPWHLAMHMQWTQKHAARLDTEPVAKWVQRQLPREHLQPLRIDTLIRASIY